MSRWPSLCSSCWCWNSRSPVRSPKGRHVSNSTAYMYRSWLFNVRFAVVVNSYSKVDERGCVHPGCRLRTFWICPIPCAHPLPKSQLRASVKMAFLVARISAQKDPCVHPFQKWPLRASNIWIRPLGFITGFLQQMMALTADTVRVQVAWGMVLVDCIPPHRQVLDNATLWLLKPR